MTHEHIAQCLAEPDIVRVAENLTVVRFESMKVASVIGAIDHLESTGEIRRGDTLVDSSSGIYAYALALVSHWKGYRCHIVASVTVDATLKAQLLALGATVEQAPNQSSLALDQNDRVARVHRYLEEHPDAHWMRQYHDNVHYLGYQRVADRIAQGTPDEPLLLVGGVGSGASTAGIAHRWNTTGVDHRLWGIQPFGSVSFGSEHVDDPQIIIAGIGSAIEFRNIDYSLYDQIHWVGFEPAVVGAQALLRDTGVFAGLSSGANYLVSRWASREAGPRHVVMLAADTGHRYTRQVFEEPSSPQLSAFSPEPVTRRSDLRPPWCYAEWSGQLYRVGQESSWATGTAHTTDRRPVVRSHSATDQG